MPLALCFMATIKGTLDTEANCEILAAALVQKDVKLKKTTLIPRFAKCIIFCSALIFSSNLFASGPVALTITNSSLGAGKFVIGWAAETNSFTNVFFTVQRTTNLKSSFTALTNVSENSALVYTDSVSPNGAAFCRIAESNAFTSLSQPGAFAAYDAGSTFGLNAKGYVGAVFDGHYVYFVPYNNGLGGSGIVLRLDTTGNFIDSGSWSAHDAGGTSGLNAKGFSGGVFDGRYVYFTPHYNGSSYSSTVLRFDTTSNFTSSASWSAYDAGNTSGLNTSGFIGSVFDGRYVYFVPFLTGGTSFDGVVLRFDTTSNFTSSASWTAYDAGSTGGLNAKGFSGGVFDGRYVYFAPNNNGGYSGTVLRFDTTSNFTSSASWSAYDASGTSGLNAVGYEGGVFDGRYIYFVPNFNGTYSGVVLRLDTTGNFTSSGSWSAYDAGSTSGLNTTGFLGGVFDGRYVYFTPNANGSGTIGTLLRFDTTGNFTSSTSWSAYDAGGTSGLNSTGYAGAISDGRYIYFAPYKNSGGASGIALRFDAKLPRAVPKTVSGGSNF